MGDPKGNSVVLPNEESLILSFKEIIDISPRNNKQKQIVWLMSYPHSPLFTWWFIIRTWFCSRSEKNGREKSKQTQKTWPRPFKIILWKGAVFLALPKNFIKLKKEKTQSCDFLELFVSSQSYKTVVLLLLEFCASTYNTTAVCIFAEK